MGSPRRYSPEDVLNAIVKMRLDDMASHKTIVNFLKVKLGYKQSRCYQLINEANERIIELHKETQLGSLENRINQLETLLEEAKKEKNKKLALEIIKELSKLSGHYTEKIELNGEINHKVEVIRLIGPKNDDK